VAEPSEPKQKVMERPFFINGGSLYLSCRDKTGAYFFVHGFTGKPIFQQTVEGLTPRKLQERDGTTVDIVGMPTREAIESAPILDAKALFQLIDTHITKYIDAPQIDRELFTYYILFSWFYPKVNTSPYLRFIADTGNGKSRMQRVVGNLCFFPIKAGGASTPSGIMRIKERWNGTLIIDEADLRESTTTNELIKYLNLGFEKGQFFIKSDKDNPREQDVFDPFCPKIIAMRKPFQDNATEGRLLSFTPKETQRTDIPFVLPACYDDEVRELQGTIARFILANWEKVDGEKTIDIQNLPIEPRLKQIALPLSIVLQLFPDGEARFREYLIKRQQEVKRTRSESWEGMIFNDVLDWAKEQPDTINEQEIPFITSTMIKDRLSLKSAKQATSSLLSIGFKSELVRLGKKVVRKLVVPDEQTWKAITQRYHFSDSLEVPICPESLKGNHWIIRQATLRDTSGPGSVSDVTCVSVPGDGTP